MEWMAHCGCRLEIRPEDGEPISFNFRCAVHQQAEVEDVSGENRAMSIARKALEDQGVDPETITTEVDPDTREGRATAPGFSAVVPKLKLAEYLATHAEAGQYAKRG